jgi:glycogen debranching enzyme
MVHFCRYAADVFPGIQSLDNFYKVMHDGENMVLKVHIPDNPPLFAWTEYEYFKHTGDIERVKHILLEKEYLQKHYYWVNNCKAKILFDYATSITAAEHVPGKGFLWKGAKAGMDNTPRGDDNPDSIYYCDLSCQQALSALYISRLAEAINEKELAEFWYQEYQKQKSFINERFWSQEDQLYLDYFVDESGFCKLLTPASLWPMIAEVADEKQVSALVNVIKDPNKLGGERPIPSVSRDDKRFSPLGEYWRGGIWMPKVYMTIKGLEANGHQELADEIAQKMIALQYRTWKNFEPHSIWECYSPTEDKPGTNKVNGYSRPDFCGWSALGPISLFIQNVLGFREVNALTNTISWTILSQKTCGIRNLKMKDNNITLIAYPKQNKVIVEALKDFTLILNGKEYSCRKGKQEIIL